MKYLLSINFRFFSILPKDLVLLSKKYGNCDGFEIAFDLFKQEEKNYVINFIKEVKKENMIINFHARTDYTIDQQKEYLDFIFSQTKDYSNKISIVFHSIFDEDTNISVNLTRTFFENIIDYIKIKKYNNLFVSIENLNIFYEKKRLTKEDFLCLFENQNLMFTYDIGHELIDEINYGSKFEPLNDILKERLFNIHIHTFKGKQDHCPILDDCIYNNYFKNFYKILKEINYKNFIVLEYGLFSFEEYKDNVYDQCVEYAKCVSVLKNILNS